MGCGVCVYVVAVVVCVHVVAVVVVVCLCVYLRVGVTRFAHFLVRKRSLEHLFP